MNFRLIEKKDILEVTLLRMDYLTEAYLGLKKNERNYLMEKNVSYLEKALNSECYIAVAEKDGVMYSCAYLNVIEKAANLRFINGVYGEIYGVYTRPGCRKNGYATKLIHLLLTKGKHLELPYIELEASSDGYELYKNIGFVETEQKYKAMKYYY